MNEKLCDGVAYKNDLYTSCDQKTTISFKLRELRTYIRFFSIMLVHMSVIYVDNISHFGESTTEQKLNCGMTGLRKAEKMPEHVNNR